jgi:hypothetical protein
MDERTWVRHNRARVGAIVCIAAGAVALLAGWIGVARSLYPAEQLTYLISGGLGGVCLIGVGALLWLSSDLQDEWTKLDLIEDALRDLAAIEGNAAGTAAPDGQNAGASAPGPARLRGLVREG